MSALALVNHFSGEIVPAVDAKALLAAANIEDLDLASMGELAAFADNTRELQSIAAEARNIVSDELVRRLDKDGRWTWREAGYEVKSASPEAGTTKYHTGLLREALSQLVADGVISPDGAAQAVGQHEHTVAIPYDFLRELQSVLDQIPGDQVDAELWDNAVSALNDLLAGEPEPAYHVRPSGVRNLLRIPAARDAIEACRLPATPPPRAARVRRLTP